MHQHITPLSYTWQGVTPGRVSNFLCRFMQHPKHSGT